MITTYIIYALFLLSGLFIIYFDMKKHEFSSIALFVNYFCICLLTSPVFVLGVIPILLCYYYKQPVDPLYVFVLCYLILITPLTNIMVASIFIAIVYVLASKEEEVSFMAPLELAIASILIK